MVFDMYYDDYDYFMYEKQLNTVLTFSRDDQNHSHQDIYHLLTPYYYFLSKKFESNLLIFLLKSMS